MRGVGVKMAEVCGTLSTGTLRSGINSDVALALILFRFKFKAGYYSMLFIWSMKFTLHAGIQTIFYLKNLKWSVFCQGAG